MAETPVGVLGASSLVGGCLLHKLRDAGYRVLAFSRRVRPNDQVAAWHQLPYLSQVEEIPYWICVAPVWVLPDHFSLLEAHGVQRVVVLSSTSRFTKHDSTDLQEQAVSRRLADAEASLQAWAENRGVEWIILRPTLIYGLGRDKNIAEIARFIRRFHFFPLFGNANGLRQPIHAQDVAGACVGALVARDAANRAYNISGDETLAYREMVGRVFSALDRPSRLLTVPLWVFRLAVPILRCLPRYREWSAAMAERMNRDLVFDHTEATHAIGFKPRQFSVAPEDIAYSVGAKKPS